MAAIVDDGRGRGLWARFRAKLAFAFQVAPETALGEEEYALLDRVAAAVRKRRMDAPAILFLESVKPLSFVGSQALVFLRPFATMALRSPADYDRFTKVLERRDGLEALIRRIEAPEPSAISDSEEPT